MKKVVFFNLALIMLVVSLSGCLKSGVLGSGGLAEVKNLNKNISGLDTTINITRDKLLKFLGYDVGTTAHDLSMGLMKGTIGYLDDPEQRKLLVQLLDDVITHSLGDTRTQLISFRNDLLDDQFITQTNKLLNGVMHNLVVDPAKDLFNMAIDNHTRGQLDSLLRMVIPAVLNDDALNRIDRVRGICLGKGMRSDIVALEDTALYTINKNLNGELGKTIHSTIQQNVQDTGKTIKDIILFAVIVILIASLLYHFVQGRKINQREALLSALTIEIEKFRKVDEDKFHVLTNNIRETMLDKRLEGQLSKFLIEEGINSGSTN